MLIRRTQLSLFQPPVSKEYTMSKSHNVVAAIRNGAVIGEMNQLKINALKVRKATHAPLTSMQSVSVAQLFLTLLAQGAGRTEAINAIAYKMGVCTKTVRRHLDKRNVTEGKVVRQKRNMVYWNTLATKGKAAARAL